MEKLDLGKEKINKLLLSFSIPCIVSMLINSIYNIVDQIFIGQGVGTIGNAATNVIFPIVIICTAVAGLIGNGCAAYLSLRLGEGNQKEARIGMGSSITLLVIASFSVAILGEIFLPVLVRCFGCTDTVYASAITYGRIILLGAPFMIMYTGLSAIIRADGSPKYSMNCLVVGAIINLVLDPLFIFGFHLGVAGGALATIVGQFVSFVIAICYLKKIKSVTLEKKDYRLNHSIWKTLGLGASSFITQMTVLALFVVMNNLMTKYGASTKFGSDIPLSVYGVISKLNSLYVSSILGISIGAQPIIGFNYGAGNKKRVKETLRKVMIIGFVIGLCFNAIFLLFPSQVVSVFITKTDPSYQLFMEFAVDCSRIFLMLCFLNAFEMCSSITIQSLGNIKKATLVSFTRQIILFIPIALILCSKIGLYGALYAGPIADGICFIVVVFIFGTEYKKLDKEEEKISYSENDTIAQEQEPQTNLVITIAREYGSGGRYVGKLLAEKLGIPCYDRELIRLAAIESGLNENYIASTEEQKQSYYENDDRIFIAESKVIEKLSETPCVIVGRSANYVLRHHKNVLHVFLYSDIENKKKRVVNYYHVLPKDAKKIITKQNRLRAKYHKYYTQRDWYDFNNYDIALHVDKFGIDGTVEVLNDLIKNKIIHK